LLGQHIKGVPGKVFLGHPVDIPELVLDRQQIVVSDKRELITSTSKC